MILHEEECKIDILESWKYSVQRSQQPLNADQMSN